MKMIKEIGFWIFAIFYALCYCFIAGTCKLLDLSLGDE